MKADERRKRVLNEVESIAEILRGYGGGGAGHGVVAFHVRYFLPVEHAGCRDLDLSQIQRDLRWLEQHGRLIKRPGTKPSEYDPVPA